MALIRTSFIAAVDFGLRAVLTLLVLKVLAVKGGASGVVLFGQFQSGIAIITLIGGGLFTNGIIKYSAEFHADRSFRVNLWSSVLNYAIIVGLILSVFLYFGANFLNRWVFNGYAPSNLIQLSAVLVVPLLIHSLFIAFSNGVEKVALLAFVRLSGSFFMAIAFFLILLEWGAQQSLISIAIGPALGGLFSVVLFTFLGLFKLKEFNFLSFSKLPLLKGYGLMALVSTIAVPLTLIYVRRFATNQFGIVEVGNWEGSFRIADQYLAFISSVLAVYFLPKIAKIKDGSLLKKEVNQVFKFVLVSSFIGSILIFIFKDEIVRLLLSIEFSNARELIGLQLVVSFVKIMSWVYAYVLLAKGLVRQFIVGEILASVFTIAPLYFLSFLGIKAICYSMLMAYLIYFLYSRYIYKMVLQDS